MLVNVQVVVESEVSSLRSDVTTGNVAIDGIVKSPVVSMLSSVSEGVCATHSL